MTFGPSPRRAALASLAGMTWYVGGIAIGVVLIVALVAVVVRGTPNSRRRR